MGYNAAKNEWQSNTREEKRDKVMKRIREEER